MNTVMSTSSTYPTIARAIQYLNDHFQEQPDLAAVAAHVHLSPFHLQRLFVEWAGLSPKKFLQYLTLDFAKKQLRSAQTLAEVAQDAGLSGTSRLHDLFVTIEGVSPGAYKSGGHNREILYGSFESPFGLLLLGQIEETICFLRFGEDRESLLAELREEWPAATMVDRPAQLERHYAHLFSLQRPPQALQLKLRGTPFQLKVWEALLRIPEGKCVSYQQVADAIGQPKASRAVGTAIGRNPIAFLIPCHRVLRQTGDLGGYRWGLARKQAMLAWEGVREESKI